MIPEKISAGRICDCPQINFPTESINPNFYFTLKINNFLQVLISHDKGIKKDMVFFV